jgi:hypothetical protein
LMFWWSKLLIIESCEKLRSLESSDGNDLCFGRDSR